MSMPILRWLGRHDQQLTHGRMLDRRGGATGPTNRQRIDGSVVAEAEVGDRLHLAQVTRAGVDGCTESSGRRSARPRRARPGPGRRSGSAGAPAARPLRPRPAPCTGRAARARTRRGPRAAPARRRRRRRPPPPRCPSAVGSRARPGSSSSSVPPVQHAEQPVRLADVVEEQLLVAVVVEVGRDHRAGRARRANGAGADVAEQPQLGLQAQPVRALPVRPGQVEPAVAVGVERHDPRPCSSGSATP